MLYTLAIDGFSSSIGTELPWQRLHHTSDWSISIDRYTVYLWNDRYAILGHTALCG